MSVALGILEKALGHTFRDRELLERAFAIAGDPEPETACAEVNVYLEVDASAEAAFDTIATVEGYRGLMAGKTLVIPGLRNWLVTESLRISPRKVVTAVSRRLMDEVE